MFWGLFFIGMVIFLFGFGIIFDMFIDHSDESIFTRLIIAFVLIIFGFFTMISLLDNLR